MDGFAALILGVCLLVIGAVNIRGNISTIHSYNRRRVKEEDVSKYGKAVGAGTLTIGAALLLDFVLEQLQWQAAVVWVTVPAFVGGLGLILYGQFRYNGGMF